MMRFISILVLAATMALALNAPGIAGVWKGSTETQGGAMEATITIESGSGVAGFVAMTMAEGKIQNGKLEGDKITFEIETSYGKVAFAGTVAGDEMKLTMTGPSGNQYPLPCKRQK
jgi:hypothetical protein